VQPLARATWALALLLIVSVASPGCARELTAAERATLDSLDARGVAERWIETRSQAEFDHLTNPSSLKGGDLSMEPQRDAKLTEEEIPASALEATFRYQSDLTGEAVIRLSRLSRSSPWRVTGVDSGG